MEVVQLTIVAIGRHPGQRCMQKIAGNEFLVLILLL